MLHLVKEGKSRPITRNEELVNPVEDLWDIELLYGRHPQFSVPTYGVRLKTKLEGGASKCYLVIELEEKFDVIVRELNVFGVMQSADFHRVIEYVKQLKIQGIFTRVPNLQTAMENVVDADEGLELFELVKDAVLSDPDSFPPISSDGYRHGEDMGVRLDTEQYVEKYGPNAVGITTEALLDILQLDGGMKHARLLEIVRGWRDLGVLLKRSKQPRLQEPLKPNISSKEVKRFYIFRIDDHN